MSYDLIKANLNLYAVFQNLEELVAYDSEIAAMAKDWDIAVQFSVKNGPKAFLEFKDGKCTHGRGKYKGSKVKLFLFSPEHANKMADEGAAPIPVSLKAYMKLPWLLKDFDVVTKKLEYYLMPTDELLKDKEYLAINTRMTMNTAAHALREIGLLDPIVKGVASHIRNGTVLLKVLPDGPAANVTFRDGDIIPGKGNVDKPMAVLTFKNVKVANDFLNGKSDAFTAIASGDVTIKGQTGMMDGISLILDRIPHYLG